MKMKKSSDRALANRSCDFFEEIDAVIEEEVELAGIHDAELGEQL